MEYPSLDRNRLLIKSLHERKNKISIERDCVEVTQQPACLSDRGYELAAQTAERIRRAVRLKKPVILAFGAHAIKNGLSPVLNGLMEGGWLTHLATNGAGIIHDWEFAFQGESSEDVRENVKIGEFGIWQETGFFINLALLVGAYENLGYGESVGKMIASEGLTIPDPEILYGVAGMEMRSNPGKAAAAIDLAGAIRHFNLPAGFLSIPHPWKKFSVQAKAFELGIPFTGHPMIGHDIIYTHPMNHGAAVGRTALHDFLTFAGGIHNLDEGVYLSVGSAIMSPMIFEKALSMAQNIHKMEGNPIVNHYMLVVDLAKSEWDWQNDGEPPPDHPAYYLRYCKTFSRMGGTMDYLTADNRDFLLALYQILSKI